MPVVRTAPGGPCPCRRGAALPHPITVLWTVPRSVSTSFERMMSYEQALPVHQRLSARAITGR
jgi:hypothetical protein